MSHNPPSADIRDAAAIDAMFKRRLSLLDRLCEIGLARARAVSRRAISAVTGTATPGASAAKAGCALVRIARAVRLAVALSFLTFDMFRAWKLNPDAPTDMSPDMDEQGAARAEQRAAAAEARGDREETEDLLRDIHEPLTDREDFSRLLQKPFDEVIARICRDLGVRFDLSLWEDGAPPEAAIETGPQTGDGDEWEIAEIGWQRRRAGPAAGSAAEHAEKRGACENIAGLASPGGP